MRVSLLMASLLASATAAVIDSAAASAQAVATPLVIGHRGASGYRPEHTLASYQLAIDMGADCVEPDLVMTRDGALVTRHEPEIGATTDAAERFPDRKSTRDVDGTATEGWFTDDFTLAELKTLRAKQPRDTRASAWDGIYPVPTLQEVIDLVRAAERASGRTICIYPETKHPTYFADKGLDIDTALVKVLDANGYEDREAPVFIQSFETGNLKKLAGMTQVKLVQLMDDFDARPYDLVRADDPRTYRDLMRPDELKAIAAYAAGIGPWKRTIVAENDDGSLKPANTLIADAHAAGLVVHPYTFRDEPSFLAATYGNDPAAEYRQFYALGVDGVFTDFPDTAVRARETAGRQ